MDSALKIQSRGGKQFKHQVKTLYEEVGGSSWYPTNKSTGKAGLCAGQEYSAANALPLCCQPRCTVRLLTRLFPRKNGFYYFWVPKIHPSVRQSAAHVSWLPAQCLSIDHSPLRYCILWFQSGLQSNEGIR